MATENNIKKFTAADIEKYHKGLLSTKEMHDLEKAALDDPFLAEAIEGYSVAGIDITADIADLKNRLEQKTAVTKVIPIVTAKRNKYNLLKVAAMFVFVAGAAFSLYKFGFNKKTEEIAQAEPLKKAEKIISDSSSKNDIETKPVADDAVSQEATNTNVENKTTLAKPDAVVISGKISENDNSVEKTNDLIVTEKKAIPTPPPAPIILQEEEKLQSKDVAKNNQAVLAKQESNAKTSKERDIDFSNNDNEKGNRSVAAKKVNSEENSRNQTNIFRGRVTDENNVGIPFANVVNLEENTGTYSDANGYFNLTFPDTVLNVQVRSIGFENNNVQLRNVTPSNQVVLQNDRNSLSEVVISNQKPNYQARAGNNKMQLEEPEPADGWVIYDNYLLNNLNYPEQFKSKPPLTSGEVKVSFEVNTKGEPVNFKIEKSLCSKCDKEAIRLIKEGPKWKRKAKNGRAVVTIPF